MKSAVPLKPMLTYSDQIKHLRDKHGLIIESESFAEEILASVGYYRLSGYGIGMIDTKTDRYISNFSFNKLHSIYLFDSQLRNLLSGIIETVEIEFRVKIAYRLASQYGPAGYLDDCNFNNHMSRFSNKRYYDQFIDSLNNEVAKQSSRPIVIHHNSKYGGQFPIWVAVELISFGTLSTLYSSMSSDDQKAIAKHYSTNYSYVRSWFASLVELRNICAHYGRLYDYQLRSLPKLPKRFARYNGSHRLFPILISLCYILRGRNDVTDFIRKLDELISRYDMIELSSIGFPENWCEVLNAASAIMIPNKKDGNTDKQLNKSDDNHS